MKQKKTPSIRTKAIAHYTEAHIRFYGCEPTTNLNGVSNEEIWAMGDDLENMANNEAMEALDSYQVEAEEIHTGGAFSSLGELLG